MKTIDVHCSKCNRWFQFNHPSVNSVERMLHVTLNCEHCGALLKAPDNAIHMMTMEDYLNARFEEHQMAAKVVDIKSYQDNLIIEVEAGPEVTGKQYEDAMMKPTPAIMPHVRLLPPPPASPTPKAMAHTKGKPRADRPLTQKPFSGLDDLLK